MPAILAGPGEVDGLGHSLQTIESNRGGSANRFRGENHSPVLVHFRQGDFNATPDQGRRMNGFVVTATGPNESEAVSDASTAEALRA